MSKIDFKLIEAFQVVREEILSSEGGAAETGDVDTAAAILVLASELNGARDELKRIAQVLGADEMDNQKMAQSDTPSTMLSLLTALKATQT